MPTSIAVALTCWLCVLVAAPRKPLPNNEVQELVYARLLGRHQRLMMLAVGMTVVMVIAFLLSHAPTPVPQSYDVAPAVSATNTHRPAIAPTCTGLDDSGYVPTCDTLQPNGTWQVTQQDWEGTWQPMGTVTMLPTPPVRSSYP